MGWWRRFKIVLKKELRDHGRDRRALLLALVYPMMGPLLVAGGLVLAGKTLQGDFRERAIDIPALGLAYAPDLVGFLKNRNVRFVPAPENPTKAVREGAVPVVLVIPKSARGKANFTVQLLTNLGRVDNLRVTAQLNEIINAYNQTIGARQARAAGLPADYGTAVQVERVNVARKANVAVFFYNMIAPLVIFMIFLGGVHLAVDTTVGERERGSLEPLLLAPVERWVLLLAKAGAALAFTALTTAVNLAAFGVFLGLAAASSARLASPPGWDVLALIFVLAVPMMAVAVAVQMAVAVVSRSMKEAQIYLGLLPLVPALPGMVMVFSPLNPTITTSLVPVLGQMLLINQMIGGQTVDAGQALAATASTGVLAALIFWLAAKWFRREKMFVLG